MAIDLYNGGLDHILRAVRAKGPILPGGKEIELDAPDRPIRLRVNLGQSSWKADDIDELLMCWDYQVSGLPMSTYQFGLGVPLIGVRHADAVDLDTAKGASDPPPASR